jgi:hypothetical protein
MDSSKQTLAAYKGWLDREESVIEVRVDKEKTGKWLLYIPLGKNGQQMFVRQLKNQETGPLWTSKPPAGHSCENNFFSDFDGIKNHRSAF